MVGTVPNYPGGGAVGARVDGTIVRVRGEVHPVTVSDPRWVRAEVVCG